LKIGGKTSDPPRDKGALVRSAAEGDPEACREIFDRTIDMVFHILNIYTHGDREAAKDLSQTVFMKFFDNLGSLKPPYHYAAWCARIAHNCGIDHVKESAREKASQNDYAALFEGEGDDPERLMLSCEFMRAISDAFGQDTDDVLRLTGRMFYRDDKTVPEIASELGVSQSTVTTRLSRFRALLREHIARKLEEA
jgi:RNA polymerase sigma factor (sigma-70 family)